MTTKLNEQQLVKTKTRMLKWLRSKKPRAIVATDMLSNEHCLFGNFFRAQGLETFDVCSVFGLSPRSSWVANTINAVKPSKNGYVTAAKAIKVVKEA